MELYTNFDHSSFNLIVTKNLLNYPIDPPLNVMQKKKFKKLIHNFIAGRLSRKKAKNIQAL